MRIALMACVHGNPWALQAVLEDAADRGVDERYILGDLVGEAPGNNEVVALVRKRHLATLMGHWDAACATGDAGMLRETDAALSAEEARARVARVRGAVEPTHQAFLAGLPRSLRFTGEGVRVHLAHGSPLRLTTGLAEGDAAAQRAALAKAKADVVASAHTHTAFVTRHPGGLFVNVGSVGAPADGPEATYALLTLEDGAAEAELRRVAYDVTSWERAQRRAAAAEP